jgi:hypothetical protein
MAPSESRKSYTKALVLLIAIVALLFVGTAILKILSSPARPARALFGTEMLSGVPYRDDQKDSVQRQISGFWFYDNVVDSGAPFLRSSDRMEIKPNGIYWRVQATTILLPSGDSSIYMVVSTGFMSPYYHTASTPDSLTGQVHYIGASVVSGNDTCYLEFARPDPSASMLPQLQTRPKAGEGEVDTVWNIVRDAGRLFLGTRAYSRYDTSGAALLDFFPKGIVETVNKFSLSKCTGGISLEIFAKRMLQKEFSNLTVRQRTAEDIQSVARRYYQKLFAQNLARRITVYGKGTASISFPVDNGGRVGKEIHVSSRPWNMKLDAEMAKEVRTWYFPACVSQKNPITVKMEFSY